MTDAPASMAVAPSVLAALLDSLIDPVLFADTGHTIRYMNKAAVAHYPEGTTLLGRSVIDCHNAESNATIREVFAAMQEGEEERLITDNAKHRIYMRAVRGEGGELLGYYERYAPPAANRASQASSGG
jgi:DUF438 domain-containing protein